MVAAILAALPEASLLVVDDSSPDGTGRAGRHARGARGARLGPASARQGGARRRLPRRVPLGPRAARDARGGADGRRLQPRPGRPAAAPGAAHARRRPRARHALHAAAATRSAGRGRRKLISRGGTLFARTVLLLPYRDLTGGFKAWRARAARGDPAARDERLRLRLPDRDDLVGAPPRRPHRPGADRLPRARRRRLEDDRRHRARGAAARPQAALGSHPRRVRP